MNGAGASYDSEVVWNDNDGVGSSGGISTYYGIPSWQQGINMAAVHGSSTMRNTPDVAMVAEYIYVYVDSAPDYTGGTSFGAPLWAAFTALVNEQAAANGQPPVGFLNPQIYTIGKGTNYTNCFHDVTRCNNTNSFSPYLFLAATGYDPCTGWGTPNGSNLINALAPLPFTYTTTAGAITITGYTGPGGAVSIPASINGLPVTSIGDSAFADRTSLTSVTMPSSVTSIESYAFNGCRSLTNVTIAGSVTSIREAAFGWCISLTNVTIPSSVTSIASSAFIGCTSLTAITVAATNPFYSSVNGVLFDKRQTTLVEYPGGLFGSYTIPGSVTNIGDGAFCFCTALASVTIPASVTSVGDSAFYYCTNLTNVYFTGNAPSADSIVFSGDNNATLYYLPGTTGWSSPFAGLPTVLWNPLIQASGASFGVRNDQFGFTLVGTANIPIVVEACNNLGTLIWTPLQTLTLTNGSVHFSEPVQTNSLGRFYRIASP